MRKRKVVETREAYWYNKDIYFADYYLDGELIKPGTLLRIKNDRTAWSFSRMVVNAKLGTEWVELTSPYGWKSVRPDRIMGTFIKKSRRKRKGKNGGKDST